jgi:hypothetical protein
MFVQMWHWFANQKVRRHLKHKLVSLSGPVNRTRVQETVEVGKGPDNRATR